MSEFRQEIMNRVKKVALGNSDRGLKHLASDLLNEYGKSDKAIEELSEATYLCKHTIRRIQECSELYSPRLDTIERCLKAMNCEITAHEVEIEKQYQNRPKTKEQIANEITDDPEKDYLLNPLQVVK